MNKLILGILTAVFLVGCTTTPPSNIQQPMTAKPTAQPKKINNNGSIYNSGAISFFEDQKPRDIGDTLTINIVENTKASVNSNSSVSKNNSNSVSLPVITGLGNTVAKIGEIGVSTDSSHSFSGKGAAGGTNLFTGSITVTVIEVLENGNLVVSGEKQISIGGEQEYIRLSGIINPRFVINNVIASNKVADAKIEYKNSGQISDGLVMPFLSRFFMSFLPF
jgi:flagellar L-ring protein FlgH